MSWLWFIKAWGKCVPLLDLVLCGRIPGGLLWTVRHILAHWPVAVAARETNQVVFLGAHWANWNWLVAVETQMNQVVLLRGHSANWPMAVTKQTNSVVVLACHCLTLTKQTNSVVVLACHWSHWITKLIQVFWSATKRFCFPHRSFKTNTCYTITNIQLNQIIFVTVDISLLTTYVYPFFSQW